jgi:hypothetical protein
MATAVMTRRKKRARPSARKNGAYSGKTGKRSVTAGNAANRISAKTRLTVSARTFMTTTKASARLTGRIKNEAIAPMKARLHPMRNKYCVTLIPVYQMSIGKDVREYPDKTNKFDHRASGFSDDFIRERISV